MSARYVQLKAASTGTVRTETYLGRVWTVVPVVALVEGCIQPMMATEPELVTEEVFSRWPSSWNGRPVFVGHPLANGVPVSGNTPPTLEALGFGQVFNARLDAHRLVMEAWIDNDRASVVPDGQAMLDRIEAGDPIEISVGAYVEVEEEAGEFNGQPYGAKWTELVSDHLALLQDGVTGACSREMGCGVRAAQQGGAMSKQTEKGSAGLVQRLMSLFRASQSPEQMSDIDVRRKLSDELKERGILNAYPEAVYDADFVYYQWADYDYSKIRYFRCGYAIDAAGDLTITGDPVEVEPIMSYEPIAPEGQPAISAAARAAAPVTAASGAGCSCGAKAPKAAKETDMNKRDALLAKVTGLAEADLDKVVEAIDTATKPADAVATTTPAPAATPAPAVASAAPTFESLLALASPDVREAVNTAVTAAAARKVETVKTLKDSGRCDLTDERLNAMSQGELDSLVKLAGIKAAAVDFGGQGLPRTPVTGAQSVPDAPDLTEAIKANQAKGK